MNAITLGPRAGRLAAALEQWPGRTVTLPQLWILFADVDPSSTGSAARRGQLATALDELAAAGALTQSKARDRTAEPTLPARVTLPSAAPTASATDLTRAVPWRPELAWVLSARVTVGQVGQLQIINQWLRDRGRDSDIAPLRERSLELFGQEKQLDRLVTTAMFAPGRLTLSVLRTFRARPPLAVRRVGDGTGMLVIENADTFDTLLHELVKEPGPIRYIAWGAGAAFEASIASILHFPEVTTLSYFGDLDADGLRIPASASAVARVEHLPLAAPATGLYELLLTEGQRQLGQVPVGDDVAHDLAAWLAPSQRSRVRELLTAGARLPQEAITSRQLVLNAGWREGLCHPSGTPITGAPNPHAAQSHTPRHPSVGGSTAR